MKDSNDILERDRGCVAKSPDQSGTATRAETSSPPTGTSRIYERVNVALINWTKENASSETISYTKDSRGGASTASLRIFLFTK